MRQSVPKGPLVARFHGLRLDPMRAGAVSTATVEIENAGTIAWRSGATDGVHAAYHWLDDKGNAIVWDGVRTPLPHPVPPGGRVTIDLDVMAAIPPAEYRFSVDLILEDRAWFAELGGTTLEQDVTVVPRIARRLAVEGADPGALEAQEEPVVPRDEAEAVAYLAPGVVPAPDWSRRILDLHQEGYGLVGGSVAVAAPVLRGRRARGALGPWRSGVGRVPRFPHPLVCPSATTDALIEWAEPVLGLPAARAGRREPRFYEEPSLYDGRVAVTARPRSGRPPA
jgi:hypothetical protein